MNNVIKKIDIDLYSPTSYEVIKAQQGDNISRIIEFALYNQGEPYIIPGGIAVKMEGHRGDNSSFIKENCAVSNNCITATLDGDVLHESGTVEAKIVLYDLSNDAILSTIPFKIHVQKNPCDKNKIESQKHSVIDWIVLCLEKLKSKLKDIEKLIADEVARATGKENEIASNLSAEINRATSSENALNNTLNNEITRATTAENALDAKKANISSPVLIGTPTAPTAPAGTNTKQIATTSFVQTAVSDGIAASDALIFKGTIGASGTIAHLPTSYKTGWTYRVTTGGTYAGEVCEIGDLIVALADRSGSGNLDSDWCVAQTNINGAITGIRGDNAFLSCSQSGSSVTISHKDVERSDSSSSTTLAHGNSFLAIKSVTSDKKGHITGIHTETLTLPAIGSADAVHLKMPRTSESPSDLSDLAKYPNGSLTVKEFAPVPDVIPELPSEAYYHTLIGQSADPAYATELALGMTSEKIAYRMKYAGGWRPWRDIVHSGNIGEQSVKRASIASGIQSMQTGGAADYPEGSYLIRSVFDGTGFKLVCKNNNSDAAAYGVIVDRADKAITDGSGNVIANTYAKKSIYGDSFIKLGGASGAPGQYSFSCGTDTSAPGWCSQALGSGTFASEKCSHALGRETMATNYASHACGKHNKKMNDGGDEANQIGDAFVIGNGVYGAKSNAIRITYLGDVLGTKAFQSSGADYAEFIKPWADGNPEGEDRIGYFVTIKDGFLEKAEEGDCIVGITSGNPSVVGNADEDYYWRYERDEFNRIVMEDVPELIQEEDGDGNPLLDEETGEPVMVETGRMIPNARMKLSENYDPSKQESYVPRADRTEWDCVGMVGVLPIRDDGSCIPGRFCRCGKGGTATFAPERGFDSFLVLERISDCVVSVIL